MKVRLIGGPADGETVDASESCTRINVPRTIHTKLRPTKAVWLEENEVQELPPEYPDCYHDYENLVYLRLNESEFAFQMTEGPFSVDQRNAT